MNELALFAGAGGGILGGHLLGWRTVCAVEWEQYPLYTAPPRKEWVGLTDEEILSAAKEVPITCIRQRDYDLHFAPIIEAKLREKNT